MTEKTMTKAAFARLCEVSKPAVAKWVQRGNAVLAENGEIHLEATAAAMRHFRRGGLPAGFAALLGDSAPHPAASAATANAQELLRTMTRATQHRRADLVERLLALDWKKSFEATDAEVRCRVEAAAASVGLEPAESDLDDDGHWGGYQLRDIGVLERHGELCFDAIVAGYGFELDEFEVLVHCREKLTHPDDGPQDDDDLITMDLELLPALAYPFGPMHKPHAG